MLTIRYFILSLLLAGSFPTNSWGESAEKAGSWKYFVERTTTKWDKITNKKETHVDRAFVHYGAGAEEAGGQKNAIPQVVYIDKEGNQLATAVLYYGPPILPRRDAKKFELRKEFAEGVSSGRNQPVPVSIVANNFPFLPLKPERELKKGLEWSPHVYMCFVVPKLWFPVTIKHKAAGYQKKKGRTCLAIEYTVAGGLKTVDYPERFAEDERRGLRGEYHLKGKGTAYFDTAEEIIVEKEQTLSWTRHGERGRRLGDGRVEWVTTQDLEESVDILVSLQPQEGGAGGLPPAAYVLIIGGAGIVIAAVVLLRKRARSNSK